MKKVAIAGYGLEGEVNYRYWKELGAEVVIYDEHQPSRPVPEGAQAVVGPDVFSLLKDFDLVVRTASLRPDKIKTNGKIWSATNEFFARCPARIIGVTGTKGKGTSCTLIARMLESAGETVHLVGNIGVLALEELPKISKTDIVVFELSSFQLWDLERSPETAVVLMIEPDHMDIHGTMKEYLAAKAHIATSQKPDDLLVYHPTNPYSAEIANGSPGQKKRYQTADGAQIVEGQLVIAGQVICHDDEIALIGRHNRENICAALTAVWRYTQNVTALKQALTTFSGLPHRLELIRELNGVRYFNDSFSSAPGATIAALNSFTQPEICIIGGYDRGLDYSELAQKIVEQKNIKNVLLIGETGPLIARSILKCDPQFRKHEVLSDLTMTQIVEKAAHLSTTGDVVLLSPGCASFDMFHDFKDRGEQFKAAVSELR